MKRAGKTHTPFVTTKTIHQQGRAKKDAKQAAAAGILESLLEYVPETVFTLPGKSGVKTRTVWSDA